MIYWIKRRNENKRTHREKAIQHKPQKQKAQNDKKDCPKHNDFFRKVTNYFDNKNNYRNAPKIKKCPLNLPPTQENSDNKSIIINNICEIGLRLVLGTKKTR